MSADITGGPEVLSEVSRRAWALEQANTLMAALVASGATPVGETAVQNMADKMLAYLETPFRVADAKLIEAARGYDGRQDAGTLIGMLADALERIGRGG